VLYRNTSKLHINYTVVMISMTKNEEVTKSFIASQLLYIRYFWFKSFIHKNVRLVVKKSKFGINVFPSFPELLFEKFLLPINELLVSLARGVN
jgi:hypothetical protein